MPLSERQAVEYFHLVFLRALFAQGGDKGLIALKGGCNLRFYFGSIRYSEDIDLDVMVIAKGTLKNKVERLLKSPLIAAPLKAKALEIGEVVAPKQTETTQRWKVELRALERGASLRSKIEFSRRGEVDGAEYARIEPEVLRPYGLTPVLTTHYAVRAAAAQKIHALAGRTEPQARDVFDLALLLARADAERLDLSGASQAHLPLAIEHALGISFDAYRSKVVAFLDPDQAAVYEERTAWDAMLESVVTQLQALR